MALWRAVMLSLLLVFYTPGNGITNEAYTKCLDEYFKSRGLKILHQNIRGLICNLPLLQHFMSTYKQTDIMALTETHIDKETSNVSLYEIEGYEFISKHRDRGSGGGVGIYVRKGINWKRRSEFENKNTECIWLEISIKHTQSFLVACYYRPPNSSKYLSKDFNTQFNESLIAAQKEKKEVILLGDLNANYLKRDDCKELKTILETNGFDQLVNKPTRITQTTETLIDIIASNNPSKISKVIVEPLSLGDHELIGCVRKSNHIKYEVRRTRVRDYKNYDQEKLIEDEKHKLETIV